MPVISVKRKFSPSSDQGKRKPESTVKNMNCGCNSKQIAIDIFQNLRGYYPSHHIRNCQSLACKQIYQKRYLQTDPENFMDAINKTLLCPDHI